MSKPNTIYISLGSNKGDRLSFLQKAVDEIFTRVGAVITISGVYQTPALGFKSDDFYNSCIEVTTYLTTQETLDKLLSIEKQLGRHRSVGGDYEARTIDLDIILSTEGNVATNDLIVPHPRMQDRKFVLVPLNEIASSALHPIFNKEIGELLKSTSDTSIIKKVEDTLLAPKSKFALSSFQYLTIEGNIGAGKTSLSNQIAEEFNAKLVLERFADNPFLPKFYEDMERYAFPLEMSFLADRYQRLQDDIGQLDLFKDFVVSDYDIYKSLIFAKVTLQPEEYGLYKKVFDIMYSNLPKPGLYVYLYQNTERLLENIKKRGRVYEKDIAPEYLEKINKGYFEFIKSQKDRNVKIIDISDRDFVSNRSDYIWILEKILA
ncbi:2-amino-4-hydroxy-6-hydroxymethyldihydropteridine diphosphokinase [Aquimarina intermedia]|uniref:2-amino-4-hydroxy-6-hydroxymethyldihydropteridine pyrophosphokinase n=1 Tax=Aquimarina intermedia TaxID=350814 RepID=A0A5S5CD91_9FLAO|nr:2-amino-4-hydroxy-6-hydroxymethyldihydropteridine diphosphokinase [Aquimarina intermedia]TYP75963.1 2-amino-4-hydroxy-6-hydroxymethyldihydropteridine diphosphokinase [Aquimarina intermedia]